MADSISTQGTAPLHLPAVNRISISDIQDVLLLGWRDFMQRPSSILFLFLIYPVIGVLTAYIAAGTGLVHLVYPIAAGFALVGPIASVGVMELSRREEEGEDPVLLDAIGGYRRGVFLMAAILFVLFAGWIVAAQRIMVATLGDLARDDFGGFLAAATTTGQGMTMFTVGNVVGFVFALVALAISVVSLPMLVDGETSVSRAIGTSVRATVLNPAPVAAWGLAVAMLLAIGMIPVFAGLLVVMPVLGHANWHLYRRLIDR